MRDTPEADLRLAPFDQSGEGLRLTLFEFQKLKTLPQKLKKYS
jgi:hypothetical protein